MARTLLIGLLACGAVWMFGTGIASSHDEDWAYATADDPGRQGPPDTSALAFYGEWVREPGVGRAWRPHVEADWRPYWRGHWAWRGDWVWVSADPWGDGPFHYGEWVLSHRFGWVWVPGTVWAPARVTWVVSGPVVAWASTGIHVHIGSDPRWWVYADARTFRSPVVRPYRIPPPHVNVRGGVVTRNLGRVFVPARQGPDREVRVRAGSERLRGPVRDTARVRTSESRNTRGFDVRQR
jgi:hypothetical protein